MTAVSSDRSGATPPDPGFPKGKFHVSHAAATSFEGGLRGYFEYRDLGMTGPYDSILGREKTPVLSSMISAVPNRFDVASGDLRMCGVLVTVDSSTGKAKSIERVCHRLPEETRRDERDGD